MNLQTLFILCVAVLGGAARAAEPQAASEAVREGLVAVQSRNLDELYLRPNADLAGYRKVLIDPVRAEIRSDWQRNLNYTRNVSRWVGPDDAKRIAADVASTLESTLAETYKARGYEIAAAPEPGVLRLSASIADLYVNAPDRLSPWNVKTFTRDAGEAIRKPTDCIIAVPTIQADATLLSANRDFEVLARHTPLRLEPLT